MHEEDGLEEAFDMFHLGNRNETDCCGGQETGRHAHGSPVTNNRTVAQKYLNVFQLSPAAFIPATPKTRARAARACPRLRERSKP